MVKKRTGYTSSYLINIRILRCYVLSYLNLWLHYKQIILPRIEEKEGLIVVEIVWNKKKVIESSKNKIKYGPIRTIFITVMFNSKVTVMDST